MKYSELERLVNEILTQFQDGSDIPLSVEEKRDLCGHVYDMIMRS